VIGDDRSEMLDLVPAQLRVKVVCRPRYGCRTCEGAVVQAPVSAADQLGRSASNASCQQPRVRSRRRGD
jgi:transposase